MSKQIDLTGLAFGRLTVLGQAPKGSRPGPHAAWQCVCSCGNEITVVGPSLRGGLTRSRRTGITYRTIMSRTGRGWTIERALTTPVR